MAWFFKPKSEQPKESDEPTPIFEDSDSEEIFALPDDDVEVEPEAEQDEEMIVMESADDVDPLAIEAWLDGDADPTETEHKNELAESELWVQGEPESDDAMLKTQIIEPGLWADAETPPPIDAAHKTLVMSESWIEAEPEEPEPSFESEPIELDFVKAAIPIATAIKSPHEEFNRYQSEITELIRTRDEWQAKAEEAIREKDAIRAESEHKISEAHQRHSGEISELSSKHETVQSDLIAHQEKLSLLDEANVKLAEMVKDHEKAIEYSRQSRDIEVHSRDADIQQRDERIRELEAMHEQAIATGDRRAEEIAQEMATLKDQLSDRIQELETQLATSSDHSNATEHLNSTIPMHVSPMHVSESADARIAELEQKLLESEKRSANRAEQRSALLRNLIEIHRLSSVSS